MSGSARRVADVSPAVRAALEAGSRESGTLTECLALDMPRLFAASFADAGVETSRAVQAAASLGILQRMLRLGALLLERYGEAGIARCQGHTSDTVRGWGCFMITARLDLDLHARLEHLRPFADDAHFAVREWAWMALRPQLAAAVEPAIDALLPWVAAPSERLRRFAIEATRPRGVWCVHLPELKRRPELAASLLEPLRADPSRYVQDSVGNWLNDAAKSRPDFVRALCTKWSSPTADPATRTICRRALRSLDGPGGAQGKAAR